MLASDFRAGFSDTCAVVRRSAALLRAAAFRYYCPWRIHGRCARQIRQQFRSQASEEAGEFAGTTGSWMDAFELNKIAGGLIGAVLLAMVIG